MPDELLTFEQARERLGLTSPDNFSRFARRYGIPIVRFGSRCARIRFSDLERAIQRHTEPTGQEPAADRREGAA